MNNDQMNETQTRPHVINIQDMNSRSFDLTQPNYQIPVILLEDLKKYANISEKIVEGMNRHPARKLDFAFIYDKEIIDKSIPDLLNRFYYNITNNRGYLFNKYFESNSIQTELDVDISWLFFTQEELELMMATLGSQKLLKTLNLNLSCNTIETKAFEKIGQLFENLTELKETNLRDADMEFVFEKMEALKTLKKLELNLEGNKNITGRGFIAITKGFRYFKGLVSFTLNLNWINMNNQMFDEVGKTVLIVAKSLNDFSMTCKGTNLTDSFMDHFFSMFHHSSKMESFSMNLKKNNLGPMSLEKFPPTFYTKKSLISINLNLANNNLDNNCMKNLGKGFDGLKLIVDLKLNLKKNNINKIGIKSLVSNFSFPKLATFSIDLSENAISGEGCQALISQLEGIKALTTLELTMKGCEISDIGLKSISKAITKKNYTNLRLLLSRNGITKDGAEGFYRTLPTLQNLKELSFDFSENLIHKQSLKVFSKNFKSFRNLNKLFLNFKGNDLITVGADWLSKSLIQLVGLQELSLNLNETKISANDLKIFSKAIRELRDINKLELYCKNNKIDRSGFKSFSKIFLNLSNLGYLDLNFKGNNMFDEGLVELSTNLKYVSNIHTLKLNLSENSIGVTGVKSLSTTMVLFTSLKILTLKLKQSGKDDADLNGDNLSFNTEENDLGQLDMDNESKPEGDILSSTREPFTVKEPLSALENVRRKTNIIKRVNVYAALFKAGGTMTHRDQMPGEKEKTKEPCIAVELSKGLKNMKELVRCSLNFKGNKIKAEGLINIGKAIQKLKNLVYLNLNMENNCLKTEDLRFFLEILRIKHNLISLHLKTRGNDIDYDDDSIQISFEYLLECLKKLKFFFGNPVEDVNMAKSVKVSSSLVHEDPSASMKIIESKNKYYNLDYLAIVPKKQAKKTEIWNQGPKTNFRLFKHIIRELKIDIQSSVFLDNNVLHKFFDVFSQLAQLAEHTILNLNDVEYPLEDENMDDLLISYFMNITGTNKFTLHTNFVVPFHSAFWIGLFRLKYQKEWNLIIYNLNIPSEVYFNSKIFESLLTESKLQNVALKYEEKAMELTSLNFSDESNTVATSVWYQLNTKMEFNTNVEEFINENKYTMTSVPQLMNKICFNPSLLALLSPRLLEELIASKSDESVFSDFINLLLQKTLLLDVPTLLPAYILKTQSLSKFLTVESLGLLYYYITAREDTVEEDQRSPDASRRGTKSREKPILDKNKIYKWKVNSLIYLNLSKNIYLSSITSKKNLSFILTDSWKKFKLKSPTTFFENKYFEASEKYRPVLFNEESSFKLEKNINNYFDASFKVFNDWEFDTIDDAYSDLIINIIRNLPHLKYIDLSGLNMGDIFCQKYSDYLIDKLLTKQSCNIKLNISNNRRITNVGLKYLYVAYELAYKLDEIARNNRQTVNEFVLERLQQLYKATTLKTLDVVQMGLPTIVIDSEIISSNNTTKLLDLGLGNFLIQKMKEWISLRSKFFCHNCEREVCKICHKDWEEGHTTEKCKNVGMVVDPPEREDLLGNKKRENQLIIECQRYQSRLLKYDYLYRIRLVLTYATVLPVICSKMPVVLVKLSEIILAFLMKCFACLKNSWASFNKCMRKCCKKCKKKKIPDPDQEKRLMNKRRSSFIVQKFKFLTRGAYFVIIGDRDDPKKEKLAFKFNLRVNDLDMYLADRKISILFGVNFILYHVFCVLIPLMHWREKSTLNQHLYYLIYAAFILVVETALTYKIIKIINNKEKNEIRTGSGGGQSKRKKNLIKSFSLLNYGPDLITSQLEKYDFFSDVIFACINFRDNNMSIAYGSLFVLLVITSIRIFQFLIFTFNSLARWWNKKPMEGRANQFINRYCRLSSISELECVSHCLDRFSTKNAIKFNGMYIPQIMFSAITKFLLEDIPQFILQINFLMLSKVNTTVLFSIISTIISLISSLKLALLAKGSSLTKNQLKEKFSKKADTKKNIMNMMNDIEEREFLEDLNENEEQLRRPVANSIPSITAWSLKPQINK